MEEFPSVTCGAHPNEVDMMMRVVDPLFDITWSWTQTFDVEKALEKLKRRSIVATQTSSGRSVSSMASTVDSTLTELTMGDKVTLLEKHLKKVKRDFTDTFFDDLSTAMLLNEGLYPGVKDIDFIARYLYREDDGYKGLLSSEDINRVTLSRVFKHVFLSLAKFLLENRRGPEAMKYITLPNRVQNATYDICRKRFCSLLVDEVQVIHYALTRLSKELNRSKADDLTASNLRVLDTAVQTDADEEDVKAELESTPAPDPQPREEEPLEEEPLEEEPREEDPLEEQPREEESDKPQSEPEPTKRYKKKKAGTVDFPTPLGIALNGFWAVPTWGGFDPYSPPPRASSVARSLPQSTKSYSTALDSCSSSEESD